ncbi:MAG: HAMP domain-containing protein [Patescibacteria group bacterium]
MKKSIGFKISLFLFFLFAFLFLSLSYLNFENQKKELLNSFVDRANATSYSLQACIAGKEDFKDKRRFLNSIYKSMWLDGDINEISLSLFENGKLNTVVSSNQERVGKGDLANLDVFTNKQSLSKTIQTNNGEILSVISPLFISGQLEGTVEINFSLEKIERNIMMSAIRSSAYYGILLVFFLILNYVFLRWQIIKPILNLKSAVIEIRRGNYSFRVKNKIKKDEIGELSKSFNAMGEQLSEYTRNMEEKIAERTQNLEISKKKLEDKIDEFDKLTQLLVGRELKMIELKNEIMELEKKIKDLSDNNT